MGISATLRCGGHVERHSVVDGELQRICSSAGAGRQLFRRNQPGVGTVTYYAGRLPRARSVLTDSPNNWDVGDGGLSQGSECADKCGWRRRNNNITVTWDAAAAPSGDAGDLVHGNGFSWRRHPHNNRMAPR